MKRSNLCGTKAWSLGKLHDLTFQWQISLNLVRVFAFYEHGALAGMHTV